ncbi:hypothetical protein [Pelagibius sp. Alg239-R121]|uniref:hypothetical protein n=1 Tax=Pelagibius sp. Alg239-R121 TaxID=2993448 RepID=UPI0024A78326|nr:hypothetical protein [Pelagibius sp. Alg239-R121]
MFRGTIKVAKGSAVNPNPNVQSHAVIAAYQTLKMPTACIWEPVDGIGHAAVFIRPAAGIERALDTEGYASWFPGGDGAGPSDILPTRMVESEKSSFFDDCCSEAGDSGTEEEDYRLPEHMIPLPNLRMVDMLAEWTSIRTKPGSHYRLMRKNCSTIAARVIRAGLNKKQHLSVLKKAHQVWWTPNDVLKLAQSLAN